MGGYPLQQVSVQIEYQQNICPDEGSTRCRRNVDLLKYETSTVNPVSIDTDNYILIRALTTRVSGTTTKTTEQFGFNTNESGFYLAIRDLGTCILISQLIIFYNACPGETVNLVVRPETIAPIVGSNIYSSTLMPPASLTPALKVMLSYSSVWRVVTGLLYPPVGVSAILLPWTEKTVCVSMTTCMFQFGTHRSLYA